MNLYALISLMVLLHVTFTGSRIALSLFSIDLGATPFTVGLVMSLLAAIPMFLSVHTGRWIDRIGVMRPTLISAVMLIAGSLAPVLQPSIVALFAASILIGTGFMLAHLAINNAVGHADTHEQRTRAFSLLALGFSTSSVLGPVIAGFFIDIVGYTYVFLVLGAFPVVALGVLYFQRGTETAPERKAADAGAKPQLIDLLRNAPLRAVFIVSGLMSMGWDLFTFMVPIQGARIGLSASTIGLIMGAFGVGTFAVRLALPWIARTFTGWRILTGALALTAFVYLFFPLFNTASILMALAFVLGLGLGASQPMVMSLIHVTAPVGRTGEAVGVRSTLISVSQTFLPLMFGGLGAAIGMTPVFWTLAACLSAGAVFARKHGDRQRG